MATEEDSFEWPRLDDAPGPAIPVSEDIARRMVGTVVATRRSGRRRTPITPRVRAVLLAAAALLVAASAFALFRKSRAPAPAPSPVSVARELLPTALDVATPPATSSIGASAPPVSSPATRHASVRADGVPFDPGRALERANELRAQRRWAQSETAYEQVVRVAPSSSAAQAARIAAGELRLEELGDPRGAERLFAAADRRGGPLDEEAAWGIAEARRALGDRSGERAALEEFLRRFPSAAMAPRARARLKEIDGGF